MVRAPQSPGGFCGSNVCSVSLLYSVSCYRGINEFIKELRNCKCLKIPSTYISESLHSTALRGAGWGLAHVLREGKGTESAAGNANSGAQCSANTQHRQGTKNAEKSKIHRLSNVIFSTSDINSR